MSAIFVNLLKPPFQLFILLLKQIPPVAVRISSGHALSGHGFGVKNKLTRTIRCRLVGAEFVVVPLPPHHILTLRLLLPQRPVLLLLHKVPKIILGVRSQLFEDLVVLTIRIRSIENILNARLPLNFLILFAHLLLQLMHRQVLRILIILILHLQLCLLFHLHFFELLLLFLPLFLCLLLYRSQLLLYGQLGCRVGADPDIGGVEEPDRIVLILYKLAPHPEYLKLVQF